MSIADRFWARVDRRGSDECWPWMGVLSSGGQGAAWDGSRQVAAHRLAWALTNGPVPAGLYVLHSCEGRYRPGDISSYRCCNPAHLRPGTPAENMADKVAAGRQAMGAACSGNRATGDRNGSRLHPETRPRGECHGGAKLTAEKVLAIRTIWSRGFGTKTELAEMFGVRDVAIGEIIRRETWRHLPPAAPDPRNCR